MPTCVTVIVFNDIIDEPVCILNPDTSVFRPMNSSNPFFFHCRKRFFTPKSTGSQENCSSRYSPRTIQLLPAKELRGKLTPFSAVNCAGPLDSDDL